MFRFFFPPAGCAHHAGLEVLTAIARTAPAICASVVFRLGGGLPQQSFGQDKEECPAVSALPSADRFRPYGRLIDKREQ